ARRSGTAGFRKRAQSRLPGGVRDPLHLRPAWAGGEPGLGLHLYPGRSAHRLRDPGGLMDDRTTIDLPESTTIQVPERQAQGPMAPTVPPERSRFALSPINRRRWQNFKANRRGYVSFWVFLVLFVVTSFAEFIANDKPFLVAFDGQYYFPVFR